MEPAYERMAAIAEEIFGTEADPDQISITDESRAKLDSLTPHWCSDRFDEDGEPVAWVVVVPTTKEIAHRFLDGSITERELLEQTQPQERYEALYLCAAVTMPAYRRQGLATSLFQEAIDAIPHTEDCLLFAWTYSDDGRNALNGIARGLGRPVMIRP